MDIKLSWDEVTELVFRLRVETGGATLTLDPPKGKIWLSQPPGKEPKSPPLRDPEAEDAQVILDMITRALAENPAPYALPPGEAAALRRLSDELTEMLSGTD